MNQSIVKPDLLVYLYADIQHLQKNISQRGREYEKDIKDEYLNQIQESYFDFIKHQTDMRIIIINTNDLDFVNSNQDFELISSIIFKEYAVGVHIINP